MFRKLLLAVSLIATSAVFADDVIAEWDFSNGQIADKSGKYQMRFRGSTQVAGEAGQQALEVGISERNKPEGIESSRLYPELTPSGAFRFDCKFELRDRTSKHPSLYFWDNMYSEPNPKKFGNPEYNSGFFISLYQVEDQEDTFRPCVALGFGDKSVSIWGRWAKLEPETVHTITVIYDGKSKCQILIDDKVNKEQVVKGASLGKAVHRAVIGDRYNSFYGHFDGKIYSVKLTNVTAEAKN